MNKNHYATEKDEYKKYRLYYKVKKTIGIILIFLMFILATSAFLKNYVYTEQYYWSNDLIKAIDDNNEYEVRHLLQKKGMDVNKPGGVEFPWYLILLDEYMRVVPIETACWRGNYNIVKMLLDYGANENLDEAFLTTVEYYNEDDNKIVKELLTNGASPDQMINDQIPVLINIAEWDYEYESDGTDEGIKKFKRNTVEIYKTILEYSEKNDDLKKIMQQSLKVAGQYKNDLLVEYLQDTLQESESES